MTEMAVSLKEMLVEDLALDFVTALTQRTPNVYAEAFARSYDEPSWGEPEGYCINGDLRRSLFEHMMRNEAKKAGLRVEVMSNGRNHRYTLIHAGRFILTASHVKYPTKQVQRAIFRNQNAAINRLLMNPVLPFPEFDPLKLSGANNIYAILLHGEEDGKSSNVGFMRIAIPCADNGKYVENICLYELRQEMLLKSNPTAKEEFIIDIAHPTIKKMGSK